MSTKNLNGNDDYRELTACQRLLDHFENANKEMEETYRWASVTSANIEPAIIGLHLDNGIEALRERIAILEKRLYDL